MAKQNFTMTAIMFILLSSISFGMYSPQTGRFMQQDPIGTAPRVVHSSHFPKVVGTKGIVAPNTNSAASVKSQSHNNAPIIAANQIYAVQNDQKPIEVYNQYIDGMNLYQYVISNPIILLDPSGLKVYACVRQSLNAHEKPGSDKKIKVPHWYIKSTANPKGCGLAGGTDGKTKVSPNYGELKDKDKYCKDITFWVDEECINKYLNGNCSNAKKEWDGKDYGHIKGMDCYGFAYALVTKCLSCNGKKLRNARPLIPTAPSEYWDIEKDNKEE